DGVVAGEEAAVEDEVDALRRRDHGFGGGIGGAAQVVGEGAGGIDDDFGAGGDGGVIEESGALLPAGGDEVDEEAGVVELAVEIDDAAFEAFCLDGGEALQGL